MFELKFTTSGAAFGTEYDSYPEQIERKEIERILYKVIAEVNMFHENGPIMDINGNKIGEWRLK